MGYGEYNSMTGLLHAHMCMWLMEWTSLLLFHYALLGVLLGGVPTALN